jgi:hypothetical protein
VYGTPSRTVSHRRGKGRKYTYTFWSVLVGGDLCHNLTSEKTKEKLLFWEYHSQFSTVGEMRL